MQSLNAIDYESFLAQNEIAVVLLFALWDDMGLRAKPVLETLEREFPRVKFALLDVDEPSFVPDFFESRDFPKAPATLYYRNGKRVQISIGIGYAEIYRLQVVRTLDRLLTATYHDET